jgi:hypothetical protein
VRGIELRQHRGDLAGRQHDRDARLALRPADRIEPRQTLPEHTLVEEQQRRQRLPMRRHRDVPIRREPRQEGLDLGLPHVAGMAQAMKAHEGTHPMDVGLLGA